MRGDGELLSRVKIWEGVLGEKITWSSYLMASTFNG